MGVEQDTITIDLGLGCYPFKTQCGDIIFRQFKMKALPVGGDKTEGLVVKVVPAEQHIGMGKINLLPMRIIKRALAILLVMVCTVEPPVIDGNSLLHTISPHLGYTRRALRLQQKDDPLLQNS
jgi:hypothetical protein